MLSVADEQENLHLRKASGEVDISGKLVAFLYILGRDGLPLGEIENLFRRNLRPDTGEFVLESAYTNGWLARWAEDLAYRLS